VLLTNYKVSQFSLFLIVIIDVASTDCKWLQLEEYELSKSRKVYCHLDFPYFYLQFYQYHHIFQTKRCGF
jgi:hypothetical protein